MAEIEQLLTCGIVMPISTIDSCSEDHWRDVKLILSEAIEDAGFQPQLVSDADDVGIIQKRIIQNLYENPVVVCDVSAKNPNVMFELGMRLAFDRPTIIVKDDKTSYSFDTSPVEHLAYPRDLRFSRIVEFKEALSEKIKATYEKSKSDPNFTTFLKHFGTFKVAELKTEVVPQERLLLEEVKGLRDVVLALNSSLRMAEREQPLSSIRTLCLREASDEVAEAFLKETIACGFKARPAPTGTNRHAHFRFPALSAGERSELLALARRYVPEARWLNGPGAPSGSRGNDG
ncbi:MAG: hypothetical protein Q7T69_11200 [Rhodoferax sp.]|nr:hypothetical protein [Rhodoferax sp.]